MDHIMRKHIKVERVDSNDDHLSNILLDTPSNDQMQVLPSDLVECVYGHQFCVHSAVQDANQLIQNGSQNNQQLQQLQLSSTQPQLVQAVGKTFIYQPVQIGSEQVLPQSQQPQPMLININGNIMQLDTTKSYGFPTVVGTLVTQPTLTNTMEQGVLQQNYLIIAQNNTIGIKQEVPSTQEFAEEEPLYVNPKQYHRIMKRRQAEGRITKTRQKYLHKSLHKHAMNRIQNYDGRFHSGFMKRINMPTIDFQENPIIKRYFSLVVNKTLDSK